MEHIPWDLIVAVFVAVMGSSGLWSYLDHRASKKASRPVDRLIVALGHDRICEMSETCLRRGSVTSVELDGIMSLYLPYTEAGGNGTAKLMVERVKALPIEEAKG